MYLFEQDAMQTDQSLNRSPAPDLRLVTLERTGDISLQTDTWSYLK